MPWYRPLTTEPPRSTAVRHLVMIDNYDSFTHNAVDLLCQLGAHVEVLRNDELTAQEVLARKADGIVISPGPGWPADAGLCLELVRLAPPHLPILGICLGHQVIAEAFGGRIVRAEEPLHGAATRITSLGRGLMAQLPEHFEVARYHSLVVDPRHRGRRLEITCQSERGEIMGLIHRERPIEGVQFHPESYMTPLGPQLLAAFLQRVVSVGRNRAGRA